MAEGSHQTKHQTPLVRLVQPYLFQPGRRNTMQRFADDPMMNFHLRMLQKEVLTLHQVQQCGDEVS
jgi:hypothetical protein